MTVDFQALVAKVTEGEHCHRCWLRLATDADYDAMQNMPGFGTSTSPFNAFCWSRFGDCGAEDAYITEMFQAAIKYVRRLEAELAVERSIVTQRDAEVRTAQVNARMVTDYAKRLRKEIAILRFQLKAIAPEPEHVVLAVPAEDD